MKSEIELISNYKLQSFLKRTHKFNESKIALDFAEEVFDTSEDTSLFSKFIGTCGVFGSCSRYEI